jgi:hypothetical protein
MLSCKKSSSSGSSGSYHVTASIDGSTHTFNVQPIGTLTTSLGYTIVGVAGAGSTSPNGEVIELTRTNASGSIVAGTYTDTSSTVLISGMYTASQSASYLCGTGTPAVNYNHLKIVISSIDKTSVKGSFSGDFFLNDDPSAAKKSITSGDFYVKFQ